MALYVCKWRATDKIKTEKKGGPFYHLKFTCILQYKRNSRGQPPCVGSANRWIWVKKFPDGNGTVSIWKHGCDILFISPRVFTGWLANRAVHYLLGATAVWGRRGFNGDLWKIKRVAWKIKIWPAAKQEGDRGARYTGAIGPL